MQVQKNSTALEEISQIYLLFASLQQTQKGVMLSNFYFNKSTFLYVCFDDSTGVSWWSCLSARIYCIVCLKDVLIYVLQRCLELTHFLFSGDKWRSNILDLKVVLIYIMHHNFLTATTGTLAD